MRNLHELFISRIALTCLYMITYFHVMVMLDMSHVVELRYFNGIILLYSIYQFISEYKFYKGDDFLYLKGLFYGFMVGVFSSFFLVVYLSFYVYILNFELYYQIIEANKFVSQASPIFMLIVAFIETVAWCYVFSLLSMQYLKKKKNFKALSH